MALYAPFGTDEQPDINVKIVGGKTLEVRGQNGERNDSLSRTPYKYSSRPPWFLDNSGDETRRSNKIQLTSMGSVTSDKLPQEQSFKKQSNLEEKTGDSVGAVKISEKNNVKHFKDTEVEIADTDSMLSRLLSQFPASKFKEIYVEMAGFDPRMNSCITEHQAETTIKRHKVPIPSTLLKQIFHNFSAEAKPNMINYENLVKYLFSYSLKGSSLKSSIHYEHKPLDEGVNNDSSKMTVIPRLSLESRSPRKDQSYVSPRSLVKKAMHDREEAYLLVQIEKAFKTSGKQIVFTIEKLNSDLKKLANGTDYIRADQIQRTCSWLHMPLHYSLLDKIIDKFDVKKNGKINWMDFVSFLEKGVPLSAQQNSSNVPNEFSGGSSLPFWESQPPLGPISPRKHSEKETYNNENTGRKSERKKWDSPSVAVRNDDQSINTFPLENSYDILKVEGRDGNTGSTTTVHDEVHFKPMDSTEKPDSRDSEKTAESLDEKLERFSHLTAALLRSDVDKNGKLKARDVLRIVNNYNLIYNLHFPEENIVEIIQLCTVPNTHDVVIDELVKTLWELMKIL